MEHVSQAKAQQFEKGAVTSWEYEMKNATLNVAPISVRGRYPEAGFTENLISDAIVHVTEGTGVLGLKDGSQVELIKNDQLHIAVGDSYYFEGTLDILYTATPPWTPEQTRQSD